MVLLTSLDLGAVIAEAGDRADGILGKTQDPARLGERLQLLLPA